MLEVEQPTRNEQQTVTGSQARWNEDVPVLRVSGLRKRFHRRDGTEVIAINDVSFEVHAGELLVLLGPSGCGKTTLLRSVAGLEEPDAGIIEVQGRTVFSSDQRINIRAEQRKLSMVFQSYALWPHMTVQENIAYPLESLPRGQRPSKSEVLERVNEIMAVVGLHGLNKQYPNAISGGQQQRVALCRALIAGSSLVLFDEPLSNVDAQVREQLRDELLTMQRQLKFAALFVTHDRHEAMVLGNHIAVLNQGNLLQLDSPEEIYGRPADTFVARFIGPTNEVPVQAIAPGQNGLDLVAETPLGEIRGQRRQDTEAGAEQVAVWRPELCELSAEEPSVANRWQCTVEQALYFGPQLEYIVTAGGQTIRILTTGKKAFDSGAQAWVSVHPQNVSFLTHR